jgi:hypothetical protein
VQGEGIALLRWLACISILSFVTTVGAVSRPACAVTATSLTSFEGREEPTVLYHPSNATFTNDGFVNITDQDAGVIRYTLRYQPNLDWWDGDRNTTNDDRQRAEVKGLGAHQKTNETFRYSFDWRTDPNYIGTSSFCHIFQLKSTDGDSGAPLVTLSLGTNGNGSLRIWSGTASNSSTARSFNWAPNTWSHADIIISTALGNTGTVLASINGDGYSGVSGVPVYRPLATDYRPKWGLYRGINSALYVGTNWVEDRGVAAELFLRGDYNHNGVVDATDYTLWRNTMGQTGSGLAADGNGNYQIDSGDYMIWRANFGRTTSGSGSGTATGALADSTAMANAPEPESVFLLVGGLLMSALRIVVRFAQRTLASQSPFCAHKRWRKSSRLLS